MGKIKLRMRVVAFYAVISIFYIPKLVFSTDWEVLNSNLSNVRGLNYIFSNNENPVAMWRYYNAAQVDKELGFIKGLGVNSIRVWLSYFVYATEGQQFLNKFADLIAACERHKIYLMPIIWDGFGNEPVTGYNDTGAWFNSPGLANINDGAFYIQGKQYVEDLINTAGTSQAILVWDLMNEPSETYVAGFLKPYHDLIKIKNPSATTTIGYAHAFQNMHSVTWVDVLSFHPYGMLRKVVKDASTVMKQYSLQYGSKPILASEMGYPGAGQRYDDTLAYITEEGLGFFLFDAITSSYGHMFKYETGFLYPDGYARNLTAVNALQNVARAQGLEVTTSYQLKDPSDPDFLPQNPLPVGWGIDSTSEMLLLWQIGQGDMSFFAGYHKLFFWLWLSFGYASIVDSEEALEAHVLMSEIQAAYDVNDEEVFKAKLDTLVYKSQKVLEEEVFINHSAKRFGDQSAAPETDMVTNFSAKGKRDPNKIELIANGLYPNSVCYLYAGLNPASYQITLPNGTLLLNIGNLFLELPLMTDSEGKLKFEIDKSAFGAGNITIYLQLLSIGPSGEYLGSKGLELHVN